MKLAVLGLILALSASAAVAQSAGETVQVGDAPLTVEVFQVFELPLTIINPVLVKAKGGYLLQCSLANVSEFRELGLRYSLAVVDSSDGVKRRVISLNEGLALPPYQTRDVTFKTPLNLKLNGGERLVLMLEQLYSTEYVWNVLNTKDALMAYTNGDYSILPQVLRIRNQVDAPIQPRLLY